MDLFWYFMNSQNSLPILDFYGRMCLSTIDVNNYCLRQAVFTTLLRTCNVKFISDVNIGIHTSNVNSSTITDTLPLL